MVSDLTTLSAEKAASQLLEETELEKANTTKCLKKPRAPTDHRLLGVREYPSAVGIPHIKSDKNCAVQNDPSCAALEFTREANRWE